MAQNKTQPTNENVEKFINGIGDKVRREDCRMVLEMMAGVSGSPPRMWGPSIVGFGIRHYQYESGRQGDICRIGFSPRKQTIALYILNGGPQQAKLLDRLGKYTAGKGCLNIRKMQDVDPEVLRELMRLCFEGAN